MGGGLVRISLSILFLCTAAAARTPDSYSTRFHSLFPRRANSPRATASSSVPMALREACQYYRTRVSTFNYEELGNLEKKWLP